jgi:hypothetical protein
VDTGGPEQDGQHLGCPLEMSVPGSCWSLASQWRCNRAGMSTAVIDIPPGGKDRSE